MLRRFNIWLMSLSSQRVKDKKCLKAKKTVDNGTSFVNKEFCTNGISSMLRQGLPCLMKSIS